MRMTDIIEKKRDKKELTDTEIEFFVKGCTDKSIPDYQISALLMAIYLNGLSERETVALTLEMSKSGDILELSLLGDKTVDKHSTGGVGDKTTLVVAPIAAALGCTVAKMSGRGLGHTGGTVDKLEAITGYKTDIPNSEFLENARKNGICLVGHSGNLAAADKYLYALRDVTGTVENISLIASSIMSKKLAAGAKNIVLDVKYGSGAFMKTPDDAEKLAREMVMIGKNAGRNMAALITCMDTPLGFAVGNSLEVKEAVSVLNGNGPQDLTEICIRLAANMYHLCFKEDIDICIEKVKNAISDKSALKKLVSAVSAQGGNYKLILGTEQFEEPLSSLDLVSDSNGYVTSMNSELIGKAAAISGAGRETKDDDIDFSAGILLYKKTGDYVKKGEKTAVLYGDSKKITEARNILKSAYSIGNEKPDKIPLIYKEIY